MLVLFRLRDAIRSWVEEEESRKGIAFTSWLIERVSIWSWYWRWRVRRRSSLMRCWSCWLGIGLIVGGLIILEWCSFKKINKNNVSIKFLINLYRKTKWRIIQSCPIKSSKKRWRLQTHRRLFNSSLTKSRRLHRVHKTLKIDRLLHLSLHLVLNESKFTLRLWSHQQPAKIHWEILTKDQKSRETQWMPYLFLGESEWKIWQNYQSFQIFWLK